MSDPGTNTPAKAHASITRVFAVGVAVLCLAAAVGGCESVQGRVRRAGTSRVIVRSATDTPIATATITPDSGEPTPTTVLSQETSGPLEPQIPPPPVHAPQPHVNSAAYLGKTIESVRTNRREVALTFDDGPCANTEKVLEILKKYDAKATFFFVGSRAEHQFISVQDVVAQGNEVANHTWSHAELRGMDAPEIGEEIDRAQQLLAAETGSAPLFVRPRSGKLDANASKAIWSRGLLLVLWSTHPGDVSPSPAPEVIVKGATRGTRPGSIVLMHETNANTIVALPGILAELHRRGLKPVTLSQLLSDGKP